MDGLIVRIAEIEVHKKYLDEYLAAAHDVGTTSVAQEEGVICIFPMQAEGHRRPMGGERRREVLRVQRQRGDMQQDQAYPQLHGVCRQSSRFQRDGARVDRAAGRGPRRTRMV